MYYFYQKTPIHLHFGNTFRLYFLRTELTPWRFSVFYAEEFLSYLFFHNEGIVGSCFIEVSQNFAF